MKDSVDVVNEEYQARMERGERIRATMWDNQERVVSALTTREITHEQARVIAEMKAALDLSDIDDVLSAALSLVELFDDALFEYTADLQE